MRREVVGHIPGNDGRRWTIDTTLKLFGFDGAFGTESRVLIADWQGVGSYMELWNGVTDQMENLVQENGGRKLVVVGHSAGGDRGGEVVG